MSPRKSLLNATVRARPVERGDEEKQEAFRFISAVVERMDRQSIALFRANLSEHAGTQELLAFVDQHIGASRPRAGSY